MAGDLDEIKERLVRLEAQNEERWDSHDKRSKETWGALQHSLDDYSSNIEKLFEKFNNFCQMSAAKKEACMKEAREYTEKHCAKAIAWTLGIPAFLITVFELVRLFHKP